MIYKGYEIKISDSQGIGSFASPLTNTPYGYVILKDGVVIDSYERCHSDKDECIKHAKRVVERRLS